MSGFEYAKQEAVNKGYISEFIKFNNILAHHNSLLGNKAMCYYRNALGYVEVHISSGALGNCFRVSIESIKSGYAIGEVKEYIRIIK